MYPKFKEISLDTATWTVAFLGAIEERETKSKKPFCTFHLLDGAIAIIANLWNTEKKSKTLGIKNIFLPITGFLMK